MARLRTSLTLKIQILSRAVNKANDHASPNGTSSLNRIKWQLHEQQMSMTWTPPSPRGNIIHRPHLRRPLTASFIAPMHPLPLLALIFELRSRHPMLSISASTFFAAQVD